MEDYIAKVKAEGDTIGGIITCVIKGCPTGLGEPEFGKLHAALGAAMLSINAVKGQDICFRVAFKPVATILQEQQTIDLEGNPTTFTAHGRHDPCVLPRAVPVVEAMASMTVLDNLLLRNAVIL
jgi:chorismate synthase